MSEQLPSLISHESLRLITAAAKVGDLSDDVLSFLSASAEYHLLDVINDASNFRARGKRSRLTVDDVNASLELRGAEGSLVFSGGPSKPKADGNSEADAAANKVDLRKVANAALPVCPIEPGFHMHWLAVDGQQPLLPQNPLPSSGRGKGKGGKRSRGKQAGDGASGGGSSAVRARLSEELTTYLRRCCDAVLSRDKAKQCRALASLREDPGLQQLLPHLCTFIQSKVPEYLKRQKEPDQLAALLQMLQCLLNNKHFAFLEIYLDRLLPPLMSCLLHIDFERTVEEKAGSEKRNGSSPAAREAGVGWPLPPRWTHWKVRDYAAELLRAICDKHGHTYPTLQARANDMFYTHLARPKTMLTTMYGAITGVACLGRMPVEQTLGPRVDSLAAKISQACSASSRRRDAKGVLEANQCRMALIRAIGSSTIAGTEKLFGEGKKEKAGLATAKTAPAGADGVVDGAEQKDKNSSNGNNGPGARSSSISTSPTKETAVGGIGGGNSSSNGNGVAAAAPGTTSPDPRRRAANLRRRLDRASYSTPTAAERAAKRAAKEANAAAAAAAAQAAGGPASNDGRSNAVGRTRARLSAAASEVAGNGGAAEDGGASDLDEIIFPWYVMGLKRDGAPQGWWLTDKHRIFL